MGNIKTYEIVELSLGDKMKGEEIVFKTMGDMEEAYKDIDNGENIYVKKDGKVTKLLNQMINTKIYDGSIVLSAKEGGVKK